MRCLLKDGSTVGFDAWVPTTQLAIRSLLYLNLYLVYASVLVLMTPEKVLVTLVKELVTLVKVLVTMGKTIGDSFGSM